MEYYRRRPKRRRRSSAGDDDDDDGDVVSLSETLDLVKHAKRVLVFTGAGISVEAGISTFGGTGGLYEKAGKELGIKNGMEAFRYAFFKKRRSDAHRFFSKMIDEVKRAKPTRTHVGISRLEHLVRCYTLNVDGLHSVHMSTWSPKTNPDGKLIETHGNIMETVCESKDTPHIFPFQESVQKNMSRGEIPKCKTCGEKIRPRVMLYEDENGDNICEDWESQLKIDAPKADLILWIGISFKQAASLEYFREVRRILMSQPSSSKNVIHHIVINPCKTAMEHLQNALCREAHSEIKYARFKSDLLFAVD